MREQGTVARLVTDRGFGFIRPAEGEGDLFFHRSAVEADRFEDLRIGEAVTYEVGNWLKGRRAEDVRRSA